MQVATSFPSTDGLARICSPLISAPLSVFVVASDSNLSPQSPVSIPFKVRVRSSRSKLPSPVVPVAEFLGDPGNRIHLFGREPTSGVGDFAILGQDDNWWATGVYEL